MHRYNQNYFYLIKMSSSTSISASNGLRASISPPPLRKRRRAITDAERKALRDYYFDESNGRPPHKQLRQWFEQQFHHFPSQSTISESLSSTFAHLDNKVQRLEVRKNRAAQWPDLEDALFEWQQRMMRKEATITGEILKEIAAIFWSKLPQYADEEQPKFSTGWLDGFKNRHQIRKYRRHGEVGVVDNVVIETELKNIREHLKEYDNRDIFNMDETGLF